MLILFEQNGVSRHKQKKKTQQLQKEKFTNLLQKPSNKD